MNGRDSKIHVSDYDTGGVNLIYSSAEIFTWTNLDNTTTLVLYGAQNETYELALPTWLGTAVTSSGCTGIGCTGIGRENIGSSIVVQWKAMPSTCVVAFGNTLTVYLLLRSEAFNYWSLDAGNSSIIVKAGYLMRNASIADRSLYLHGDVNATTTLEIIAASMSCERVCFNRELVIEDLRSIKQAILQFIPASVTVPDFGRLDWRYIDSLPEIQSVYDDTNWTLCSHNFSFLARPLTTPTSLYAGDYGSLTKGSNYVITVLIDHMGLDEESFVSDPAAAPQTQDAYFCPPFKTPRGILHYVLDGRISQTDVTWKMTGNLGGVHYQGLVRGPLNEGAMFAERQGFHLPGAPTPLWEARSPFQGIDAAGVGFFSVEFELNVPIGYDVPMSFVFGNVTASNETTSAFRCQLFVDGYQFGKYGKSSTLKTFVLWFLELIDCASE